ncbi:Angiopoietin-1 receptor [Holothuria leucospilota]|uniref:Angiopoietin-1 receptor n=1 Tax=Holothuria leucospilota TaxID=206669 RepID=A0A9Q1CTI3_HOLLE|nr:Angiopoietin-1 receptor [Holothuria leucospilota]
MENMKFIAWFFFGILSYGEATGLLPDQGFYVITNLPSRGRKSGDLYVYAIDTNRINSEDEIKFQKSGSGLSRSIVKTGEIRTDPTDLWGCYLKVGQPKRFKGSRYGTYTVTLSGGKSINTFVRPQTKFLNTKGVYTVTVYPVEEGSTELAPSNPIGVAWTPGCQNIRWCKGKRRNINTGPKLTLTSTEDAGIHTIQRRNRKRRGWFVQIEVIVASGLNPLSMSSERTMVDETVEHFSKTDIGRTHNCDDQLRRITRSMTRLKVIQAESSSNIPPETVISANSSSSLDSGPSVFTSPLQHGTDALCTTPSTDSTNVHSSVKHSGFPSKVMEHVALIEETDSSVINLSSKELSVSNLKFLSKGLEFAPVPPQVHRLGLRESLECFSRSLRLAEYFHGSKSDAEDKDIKFRCPMGQWYSAMNGCTNRVVTCQNGGVEKDAEDVCSCPPFFTQDDCSERVDDPPEPFGLGDGVNSNLFCGDLDGGSTKCRGYLYCLGHLFGCKCFPGWFGNNCYKPCPKGKWGIECSRTCPDYNMQCNRFDGSDTPV